MSLNNRTFALRMIKYKLVPGAITIVVTIFLLFATKSVVIRENVPETTFTIWGMLIIIAAMLAGIKILNYNIEK